jgi:hypothetical protein
MTNVPHSARDEAERRFSLPRRDRGGERRVKASDAVRLLRSSGTPMTRCEPALPLLAPEHSIEYPARALVRTLFHQSGVEDLDRSSKCSRLHLGGVPEPNRLKVLVAGAADEIISPVETVVQELRHSVVGGPERAHEQSPPRSLPVAPEMGGQSAGALSSCRALLIALSRVGKHSGEVGGPLRLDEGLPGHMPKDAFK